MENTKIYLAGPDVFIEDSDVGERKKALCKEHGFAPLYPLDNEVSGPDACQKIYAANLSMVDEADFVLANVSPFRGPHCDPGTAFEIGYAIAQNKPVITYSNDERELIQRIREDFSDLIGSGFAIEDFKRHENLMVANVSECVCVDERDDLSAWKAFNRALAKISEIE